MAAGLGCWAGPTCASSGDTFTDTGGGSGASVSDPIDARPDSDVYADPEYTELAESRMYVFVLPGVGGVKPGGETTVHVRDMRI